MFQYAVLIIPVFAVLSYWIRGLARTWYYKTYAHHVLFENHSSARVIVNEWLSVKMLSIVVLMTLIWIIIGKAGLLMSYYGQFFFGMLVLGYTASIGTGLTSLLLFIYAHRNKDLLEGKVIIKAPLARQMALSFTLLPLFCLVPCIIAIPHPFLVGGTVGILLFVCLQTITRFTPIVF
jgi:hypothetical protein